MTNEQAKEILRLYRPGTADAADPAFAKALDLCQRDAELKEWFGTHCALYTALRAKFKQIAVPEGFKEQIIAERRVFATPFWQRSILVAGAIALVVMLVFELRLRQPREPHDFAAYRSYMESFAVRGYGMDTTLTNLDQIHSYFVQRKAIADYVLPADLQKNAKAAGCVATTWQGKEVSMICFQSGRPLAPNQESDLWLFITDRTAATGAPTASTPSFAKVNGFLTASWTIGDRTYVLATQGDEQFLGKFLSGNTVL